MGMNIKIRRLTSVASYSNLRLDFRFLDYTENRPKFKSIQFKNFINEINNGKDIAKGNYVDNNSSDIIYPTVNNFKGGKFVFEKITFVDDNYPIPKTLEKGDLIISRSGTVGITYVWNQEEVFKAFGREVVAIPSGYLIVIKINKDKAFPEFIKYFFNSKLMSPYWYVFGVGKTQKNIAQPEILAIPFPHISKYEQGKVLEKIAPINKESNNLFTQVKEPLEIINEIFAEEFNYSPTLWKKFGRGMTAGTQKSIPKNLTWFSVQSSQIALNNILRFSSRFHNPKTRSLMNIIKTIPKIKVSEVIKEKVHRGVQPKINPDGEVYAIKTGQLKNGYIDRSFADKVSYIFFDSFERARVKEGDILIASTGKVSLGKVDIFEFEDDAIVDGHISIISVDESKYNRLFFVYYFRSILGAFQIERDFTGATNQIELYADQIEAFLIPDIRLKHQEKIADLIKKALDKQKTIERQIKEKQNEISKIIEEVVK